MDIEDFLSPEAVLELREPDKRRVLRGAERRSCWMSRALHKLLAES